MSRDREKPEDREDFASRWSRLKRQTRTPPVEADAAEAPAPVSDARPDEEILKELGLPEPETMKPGDDYSGFMAAAVPARIRNRALRRLWGSKPVLANLDGLVDYAEDFTDAATVPEVLRTAYKVGRGWLEGDDEAKPAAPDAGGDEAPAPGDPAAVEAPGASPSVAEARSGEEASGEDGSADESPGDESPGEERPAERHGAPPRARMRFRFADK